MSSKATGAGRVEFIIMIALMTSLMALSIDTMLPALAIMGEDLDVTDPARTQLAITVLFAGMALGQLFYGPLSDSIGRKRTIYIGISVFLVGCLLSLFAQDFDSMLAGRLLQGLGAASARIVPMALVRDQFEGREMAKIMSFIMSVFILVPVLAPMVGQGILFVTDWRAIFAFFIVLAAIATLWFGLRQPETLPVERRRPFSISGIMGGFRACFTDRTTLGYTIAAGFTFGPFVGYLGASQHVFQNIFRTGEMFAVWFGVGAIAIGAASILNSQLVMRYGMRRMTRAGLAGSAIASVAAAIIFAIEPPGLLGFMIWLMIVFFAVGICFGNLNALALENMGSMAGIGAAFVGFGSTMIAAPLGAIVGAQLVDDTLPLVIGFAVMSGIALSLSFIADRGRPPGPVVR
ncbi:MAG: multidrug effflux MFS transporter [Minwuia sp.]|nr:multidrug effflux MFS transporter [Minwuia sp.]